MAKQYPTLGCCGLDCGLCPRYYTEGSSRCPGCCGEDFAKKHPSCSFVTCCVKKRDLEVCAECGDFPCARFEKETGEIDSFVTHRRVMSNQRFIQEHGLVAFIGQQKERIDILRNMLQFYDDGSCKSFFCLAAALLSAKGLNSAMERARSELGEESSSKDGIKARAKGLKEILSRLAAEEKEELRLRKG